MLQSPLPLKLDEESGTITLSAIDAIMMPERCSVSRSSARLDADIFDPPYLCNAGSIYAVRKINGSAQVWEVQPIGKDEGRWLSEARRAGGPNSS